MPIEDMVFGLDLLKYTLSFGGQSESTSDDYATQVKAAIRSTYWGILALEPWSFALASSPGVISTIAKQSVSVSSISGTTVTLSDTIAATMVGRKFYMTSNQAVYRISAHTAGTATLTLDATYVETETSGAGAIFQDEYALNSNCMRLWAPLRLRGGLKGEVDLINDKEFEATYGGTWVSSVGFTEAAREVRQDSSGNKQIQLAPWSANAINIEYDYTEFHNLDFTGAGSGDTPKLRKEDRWVIAERALFTLFRNKNDNLADSAWLKSDKKLDEMRTVHLYKAGKNRLWARAGNSL